MITFYKRAVLWNCRVLQYIPGFRAYGRFLERHYKKHFWTTWILTLVSSVAFNLWFQKRIQRWVNQGLDSSGIPYGGYHYGESMCLRHRITNCTSCLALQELAWEGRESEVIT